DEPTVISGAICVPGRPFKYAIATASCHETELIVIDRHGALEGENRLIEADIDLVSLSSADLPPQDARQDRIGCGERRESVGQRVVRQRWRPIGLTSHVRPPAECLGKRSKTWPFAIRSGLPVSAQMD